MKKLICEGCGKEVFSLVAVGGLNLCVECENNHRTICDEIADEKAKEIYGVTYDR